MAMTTAQAGPVTLAIGEVAARTGLTVHTLRYYEGIGLLDRIQRDSGGRRLFTEDDLGWIDLLTKLRRTGMPIAEMVEYADLVRRGPSTHPERIEVLQRHRARVQDQLEELSGCLRVVDYKIDRYRGADVA